MAKKNKNFNILSFSLLCAFLSVFSCKASAPSADQKNRPPLKGKKTDQKEALEVSNLKQALAEAYVRNPDLDSQRAQLKQAVESIAQVLSEWRPQITANLAQNNRQARGPQGEYRSFRDRSAGVNLNQSIFSGGGTVARTQKAEHEFTAGAYQLASVEQRTFLDVIQAFMDVLAEGQIVELSQKSENFLEKTVEQTEARRSIGEATSTDLAAAKAQRSEAKAKTGSAQARYQTARATFLKLVGKLPGSLEFPTFLIPLPQTLAQALDLALKDNPSFQAAGSRAEAARYGVRAEFAGLLPQIDATLSARTASGQGTVVPGRNNPGTSRDFSAQVQMTIPLYTGGRTHSMVRQAEQRLVQARVEKESARRSIIEGVTKVWESFQAAVQNVEQFVLQTQANSLALKGVWEEYSLGFKTLLDVLQVEEKWNQSESALIDAKRAMVMYGYQLLVLTGQLKAGQLDLPVQRYDPAIYYNAYRDAWLSIGSDDPDPASLEPDIVRREAELISSRGAAPQKDRSLPQHPIGTEK